MSNVVVARNSTAEPLLLNGKLYTFERSLRNTLPWKMMPLELLLALILLANSGTKMTQQSGLEVPELLDLPRELCFLPIPHLPFSDGPFVFLFPILSSFSFFCSSFSLFHPPLGKRTLSIKRRLVRSRWGDGIYQKKNKKKKVGNYLRSASYAVKLETERTKAKYVSSTMSVWGYCDILTSREKCHFTPCWLGCGVSI